jgi:O-antigen ligase/tetratricopeptide (TPR) repeat protein
VDASSGKVDPNRLLLAEAPLLGALVLAPLVAGYQNPAPALALGCLVWLSLLLRALLPGLPPLERPRCAWLVAAVPALALLTVLLSANRGATMLHGTLALSFAGALWHSADIARRGGAGRLLAAVLAGALISGGLGLREYLEQMRAGEPGWRAFSRFTNPNFFAGYLVPCVLLAVGAGLRRPAAFRPGTWLLALGLLTAALTAALMVTGSRGALLALLAGLGVFFMLALARGEFRDSEARLRVGALLALMLVVGGLFSTGLRQREAAVVENPLPVELRSGESRGGTADSNRFRVLTWRGSLQMGLKRPVLGWGAGSFETAYAPHAIGGYTRHAHQGYLQLFAEQGAVGLLAWLGLLLAAAAALWRAPRTRHWGWASGVGAALAATATHNLLDSILYVPAAGLLTWVLLGLLLAPGEGAVEASAPKASESATSRGVTPTPRAGKRARKSRSRAAGPAQVLHSTSGARKRWTTAVVAGVLLLLTGAHLSGRMLLDVGRDQVRVNPIEAVSTLSTARLLLPWDHEVARVRSQAFIYAGRQNDAVDEAMRVVRLAQFRPPGYYQLGALREFQNNLPLAQLTYEQGLTHTPNEPQLLYALALVLERLGESREALETYRRLTEVAASPVGQVHALGEVRDYRFARAHMALARVEPEPAATDHRLAAAALLAERRSLHDANPVAYLGVGEWEPENERDLRTEEQRLWTRLAEDFQARGENRLASLAAEQADTVDRSRTRLEEIIRDVRN